jgi:hypothetical protein
MKPTGMTNNKQQTAVDRYILRRNILDAIKRLNHISENQYEQELIKARQLANEIQKDQYIKSWEAGLMKIDFNEYYEQTYREDKL